MKPMTMEAIRAEYLKKSDYLGYFITYGGPERFQAFAKIYQQIPDDQYWKCVRDIWSNIEISYPYRWLWITFLRGEGRRCRETLMRKSEYRKLKALPDVLTIFRGYAKGKARTGLSWTLSESRAEFFANYATGSRRAYLCGHTCGAPSMIVKGRCNKKDILAYFNERKEEEIVISPHNVFALKSRPHTTL